MPLLSPRAWAMTIFEGFEELDDVGVVHYLHGYYMGVSKKKPTN